MKKIYWLILAVFLVVFFFGRYKLMVVLSGSMEPAIKMGSIVVIKPEKNYIKKDIITYQDLAKSKTTITHRVFEASGSAYITKGDANKIPDTTKIFPKQIIGKVIFVIPYLGYPVSFTKTLPGLILVIVIPATIIVYQELVNLKNDIFKKLAQKNKMLLLIGFLIWNLFFSVAPVEAVTKTSGDLEVTFDEPMFGTSIVWYPGLSVTKNIVIKNNGSGVQTVSIEAVNKTQTGDLAKVLSFKIDDKTLQNFWDDGQVSLSDLAGGATTTYNLTIKMTNLAGNEYQAKEAKFDLRVGFVGTTTSVTSMGIVKSASTTANNFNWWWLLSLSIFPLLWFLRKVFSPK